MTRFLLLLSLLIQAAAASLSFLAAPYVDYSAVNLFQRPKLTNQPAGTTVGVHALQLHYPCEIASTPAHEANMLLLLVNWSRPSRHGCYSMIDVLERVTLLNGGQTMVGFYGQDADMYDTTGPYSHTVYTLAERPLSVEGIAVDPLFAQDYERLQEMRPNATVLAMLTREENRWTQLVDSFSLRFMSIFFPIAFACVVVFGLYLLLEPLHGRYPGAGWGFTITVPGVMGCLSLLSLLSWAVYLPYKSHTAVGEFFGQFGLALMLAAYCLMVFRWSTLLSIIHSSWRFTCLRYASILVLGTTCLGLLLQWISHIVLSSDAFVLVTDAIAYFIVYPSVLMLIIVFLFNAVHFLFRIRKVFPVECRPILRSMTLFGIPFSILGTAVILRPLFFAFYQPRTLDSYITFQYAFFSLWILVHALILYIWAIRIFRLDLHESTSGSDEINTEVIDSSDRLSVIETRPMPMMELGWNPTTLHSPLVVPRPILITSRTV